MVVIPKATLIERIRSRSGTEVAESAEDGQCATCRKKMPAFSSS